MRYVFSVLCSSIIKNSSPITLATTSLFIILTSKMDCLAHRLKIEAPDFVAFTRSIPFFQRKKCNTTHFFKGKNVLCDHKVCIFVNTTHIV